MSTPTKEGFFGPHGPPSEAQMHPDQRCAWQNFGGKSLEEACAHFCEAPNVHQDDFMWMPEGAFRFYFPVVDRYLRSLASMTEEDAFDHRPAWILAKCIQMHFDCHENMMGLHEPILALCDYVCAHLAHFDFEEAGQVEIRAAWTDLRQQVEDDARGIRRPRE